MENNLKLKPRGYGSRTGTERVDVSSINPPFRVINGVLVYAVHDGKKWKWS